ncbi:MAG: DUF2786 domain-containing protein [Ilumatobacteraceae bacterium]
MSDDVGESVLAKVRKLLAKAEATDNVNEAEAFASKAAALIASHRIDAARLAERRPSADTVSVHEVPIGRGAYVRGRLALLGAVAAANDCQLVWRSGTTGATGLVVGFVDDLDAVVVLYESLHLQAAAQMAAQRRRTPAATQRWRRAFLFGFADRVADLLAGARRSAEDDVRASGSSLPDLVDRTARVSAHVRASMGRVAAARPPTPLAANGWRDGHRAAGAADIGRRRVSGRRAIGRGS